MTLFKTNTRRQWMTLAAAACAAMSFGVQAQTSWPAKPVTLIVPFPAGGTADVLPRMLSEKMRQRCSNFSLKQGVP